MNQPELRGQARHGPQSDFGTTRPGVVITIRRQHRIAEPAAKLDLANIGAELKADLARLGDGLATTEADLSGLRSARFRDGGDESEIGADNVNADQGTVIDLTTHQALRQSERALDRLHAGTHGTCETLLGPHRLPPITTFPRATPPPHLPTKRHR